MHQAQLARYLPFFSRASRKHCSTSPMSAPARKESILDLKLLVDKRIHVKLAGGREVEGKLKGFDQLLNLVLDDCVEFMQDPNDPSVITDQQRQLGLIMARGTAVTVINPCDGTIELQSNPFIVND